MPPAAAAMVVLVTLIGATVSGCGAAATSSQAATRTPVATAGAHQAPSTTAVSSVRPGGDQPWIAYQTSIGGRETAWLIHPDGSGDHRIVEGVHDEQLLPDWSPDGWRLAFATRGGDHEPAFEYDLRTGRSHQLFTCTGSCLGDDEPAYAPDGKTVAVVRAMGPFVGDVPSACGIWLGDLRTGKARPLTRNHLCNREYHPRWSPDGRHLTYWRWNQDANGTTTGTAIFVIDADGTHERRLTPWGYFYGDPDWSPDGKWLAFSSHPLQAFNFDQVVSNLFRMHPDGSHLQQLTHYLDPSIRATKPRYSPDGHSIFLTAVTPASRELWTMPASGGRATAITHGGIRVLGTLQPTPVP